MRDSHVRVPRNGDESRPDVRSVRRLIERDRNRPLRFVLISVALATRAHPPPWVLPRVLIGPGPGPRRVQEPVATPSRARPIGPPHRRRGDRRDDLDFGAGGR